MTLRFRIGAASILLVACIVIPVLLTVQHFEEREFRRQITFTGQHTTGLLAKQSLIGVMTYDLPELSRRIHEMCSSNRITNAVVTRPDGSILAAADPQLIGMKWHPTAESNNMAFSEPILGPESNTPWGFVHLTYSLDDLDLFLARTRMLILGTGAGACILGIALSLIISRRVTRSHEQLLEASRRVAEGEYDCELPTGKESDINEISRSIVGLIRSIRESDAKLRQAERHAAIGSLATHAAHELKNCLIPLKSFSTAISSLTSDTGHAQANFLKRASRAVPLAVQRVERLVGNLLNLARTPEPCRVSLDMRTIVSNVLELTRDNAAEQGVHLNSDMPADPVLGNIDPEQMETALLNLVSNAVQAVGKGGQVNVMLSQEVERISISVVDNGPGIPPDSAKRIFDPYFSTKTSGLNAGLGLALAQKIVLEHEGVLDVSSRPGRTEFRIDLPS